MTNPQRQDAQEREFKKRRRERWTIFVLGVFFCLLTYLEVHLSNISQKLPFVNSIFFFGLVNFNVALLLFLAFLIFRNVAKIFSERRGGLVGSQLKAKLVAAFVSFALIPTALLFLVSVFYINSSFDKWFSLKIGSVFQDSIEVTSAYYNTTKKNNYHFAQRIAEQISRATPQKRTAVISRLSLEYSLDAVEYYRDFFSTRAVFLRPDGQLQDLPPATLEFLQKGIGQGAEASTIHQFSGGNLIRCMVPVKMAGQTGGVVIVSSYVPHALVSKMDGIASAFEDYRDVNPLKYPIKSIYLIILVLVTLLIVFGATWFGFHWAKQLSEPLELLGRATEQIANGKYLTVEAPTGSEEIFKLVNSFNKMTRDLGSSESKLRAHSRYIEVVLSNISAGVISADQKGNITTINKYACQLLGVEAVRVLGRHYTKILKAEHQALVHDLMGKLVKHRAHSIQKEIYVNVRGENLVLQTTLSPLRDDKGRELGYVLVFDDLTKLINAQRASAWREVARRIAHEIKNPLTPIKLSAERLQKKFSAQLNDAAFESCTQTIIQQVDELKELVNEFSSFARLPQANPAPNDVNGLIQESVVLFQEGHKQISFDLKLDHQIPLFDVDREQMKRVFINLLDNAVAAVQDLTGPKQITISTVYDPVLRIARLVVADNGPGIPAEIRDRVFEPYFSTKEAGTGLGLAIVKRIIDDHSGFIRVFKNSPTGSRFVIELPVIMRSQTQVHGPTRAPNLEQGPSLEEEKV
jgi:two-component system nitrogen regulation sensor histidine kinase NtrY